jgi:hypothetical protein
MTLAGRLKTEIALGVILITGVVIATGSYKGCGPAAPREQSSETLLLQFTPAAPCVTYVVYKEKPRPYPMAGKMDLVFALLSEDQVRAGYAMKGEIVTIDIELPDRTEVTARGQKGDIFWVSKDGEVRVVKDGPGAEFFAAWDKAYRKWWEANWLKPNADELDHTWTFTSYEDAIDKMKAFLQEHRRE